MGIALFTFDGLFAPLQAALDWIRAQARPLPCPPASSGPRSRCTRPATPAPRAVRRLGAGPVRVLRVVDAQAPADFGRLVITGRMADVCAELDRLAAQEPLAPRSTCAGGLSPR